MVDRSNDCPEEIYEEHLELGRERWLEVMNSFDVINDNAIKAAGRLISNYLDEVHNEYNLERLLSIVREKCGKNGCAEDRIAEHIEQALGFYQEILEMLRADPEGKIYKWTYSWVALRDTKNEINLIHSRGR